MSEEKKKSKKCRKRLSEVANRREGKGEDNRSEVLHTAWGGLWESTRCSWLTQALQTSLLFPFVRALRRFLCFSSFFVLFCFLPCTLLRSGLKSDQKKCLSRGFTSGGIVHPLVLRQSRNNNNKKKGKWLQPRVYVRPADYFLSPHHFTLPRFSLAFSLFLIIIIRVKYSFYCVLLFFLPFCLFVKKKKNRA